MIVRNWCRATPIALGLILMLMVGCDYSARKPASRTATAVGPLPNFGSRPSRAPAVVEDARSERPPAEDPEVIRRREVILANVVKLMQQASENPGGRNFEMATENLNELFEGTLPREYEPTPASREFLGQKFAEMTGQDPTPILKSLSSPKFTIRDARHIEDCMLYHAVATRVAGEGDDLVRVRRLFDWLCRNVLLVPPESLGAPGVRQAQVRPADALMRGMATESGAWAERGWLFLSLCRQIGVDAGILTLTQRRSSTMARNAGQSAPLQSWVVAALVDTKPYLFDTRIGLEIPSLDGSGVATLDEVIANPEILERLELPGESTLGVSAADLAGSPTKIGVMLDSSVGYIAPRMRLLQGQLRGEYRTTLFRDPAEQANHFAQAIGPRFGEAILWSLPLQVENLLFSSPDFVAATQASLRFFDNKYPLIAARTAQLRGQLTEATDKYVGLRFAENAVDKKDQPIPREVQGALDIYATYFLAQSQLDRGNPEQAEYLFRKMLDLVPEPGPGRYFFYMLRWGALQGLARLAETRGDAASAVAYYEAADATGSLITPQHHGDLLRARRLVWANPTATPTAPLPPAPADPSAPKTAQTP